MSYHYTLYGLHVSSSLACPELCESAPTHPDVIIREGAIPVAQDQPQDRVATWGTIEEFRIYVPGVVSFRVRAGCEIVIEAALGIDAATLRLFLLGSAFGALLHQRGIIPIHGSAVASERGALIFIGPQGHGKSTLAAAFTRRGYRLLSDDICALTIDEDRVWLHPAFPRLNLLPDAVERLLVPEKLAGNAHPITGKHGVAVTAFQSQAILVRALYELQPAPIESIQLSELRGYNRLTTLMGNTYRVHFLRSLGQEASHFAALEQIARQVRVIRVQRPDAAYLLDELIAAICADTQVENNGGKPMVHMPITLDTVVVQTPGLISAEMDDETVLLGLDQGAYFGMEGVAHRIWQGLAQPQPVREIVADLTAIYDVDADRCAAHTTTFLAQLLAEGLIAVQAEGTA